MEALNYASDGELIKNSDSGAAPRLLAPPPPPTIAASISVAANITYITANRWQLLSIYQRDFTSSILLLLGQYRSWIH